MKSSHPLYIAWRHRAGVVFIMLFSMILFYVFYTSRAEAFNDMKNELLHRCGVGLPRCQGQLRCMNGFCSSDVAPRLPPRSDLPLMP